VFVRRPGGDQGPVFSPDGRWVAFLGHPDGRPEYWANRHVFVVHASGGAPADLTPGFDEQAEGVREGEGPLWEPSGESLLFLSASRTDRRLFRAFSDARPVQVVMKSTGVDAEPSLGGRGPVLAWVHEEPTRPANVWLWLLPHGAPHPLTDVNPEAVGLLEVPKRVVTWSAPDGRQVEGLLVTPVAPGPGPPPLLVVLHGGPAWTHFAAFTAGNPVYPYALLAQRGWAVLLPNPRGSAGYGEEFRGALVGEWGGKDVEDVLAGVDDLVRTGLADGNRLAVCGWSYGGYLAAVIVTQTARFKAAIVGAGMTDLGAMLASDVPELSRWYLRRWPWEDPAAYVDRSPLYRAGAVHTPTAFVHGAADRRVPPGQALAFWQALERRGVPTDFLLLPNEPHLPFDPRHQRAAMQFHLDWLTKWTLNPPPAASPTGREPRGSR
jgi:dipeptidyl aminopeptidase/acylaminoacyl peptidase